MMIFFGIAFLVLYACEFVRPVVARPRIRSWLLRVWLLNVLNAAAALAAAALWSSMAGPTRSSFALSAHLAWPAAACVSYLAYTFVFYWWHRARHASDRLWRLVHQIHHSPRRLEAVTSFYKHPVETAINGVIAAVLLFPVLGIDWHAAAACTLLAGLIDLFYHANVRTPRWVGWIVQRPEMHRLHHELERHEGNYGDLPLWDALFGTLRVAPRTPVACGFDGAREERLGAMLAGRDVHRDAPGAP